MNQKLGLIGITSELKLWRFVKIAEIIQRLGSKYDQKTLIEIQNATRMQSNDVIERQFSIMRKLKLMEGSRNILILTSDGKTLAKLSDNSESNQLNVEEKIFFLNLLFTSITKKQLITLLQTISNFENFPTNRIVINFFKTSVANSLWKTSEKNVKKLEQDGKMTSFLTNKFSCLSGWLHELELIDIKGEKITSLINTKTIHYLDSEELKNNIVTIAATIYSLSGRKFNNALDSMIFKKYFMDAYRIFQIGSDKFSDIRAIKKFIIIRLLTNEAIILEEPEFDKQIDLFASKKFVKSIMLGRDGKPAYVMM